MTAFLIFAVIQTLQQVDNTLLGLSEKEAAKYPYIASMGVYVFRTDVLLKLLRWRYPSCNDFGSEIIPSAVSDHNVQVSSMGSYFFHFLFSFSFKLTCVICSSFTWAGFWSCEFSAVFSIHLNFQAYLFNDYWEDIGTVRSFFDANLALTEQVSLLEDKDISSLHCCLDQQR